MTKAAKRNPSRLITICALTALILSGCEKEPAPTSKATPPAPALAPAGVHRSAPPTPLYDEALQAITSPPYIDISLTSLEFYKPGCWGEPELAFRTNLENGEHPTAQKPHHDISGLTRAIRAYGEEHTRRMQQSKNPSAHIASHAWYSMGGFNYYRTQRARLCDRISPGLSCNDRYPYPAETRIYSDPLIPFTTERIVSSSFNDPSTVHLFSPKPIDFKLKGTARLEAAAYVSGIPQLACLMMRDPWAAVELFNLQRPQ